ncbi:TetR/AcrR family transcriptional regulator [Rhodococcus sp. ABRD24]|uniref:ScbR family autoregulator-binding transcription factor n=1 Tax=Rhodococcus sp. ABRD24 TaxID=2507582 RepID=UPI00103A5CA6|nr:ScbR family autoregulator-binding transcription factor [Rhodococcus sp. ABRD24]QBJ97623.1 TetR/AcrR family transcriptional regulator [Rhodococcus sp. ABRD24]
MARQDRAEATRDSVLRGAAEVFGRLGYAQSSLSEIIIESKVTKGALYFHFASKEELARAVIDEGCARLDAAVLPWLDRRTPALEALIGMSCVISDTAATDVLVRSMFRLVTEIGDYRGSGTAIFDTWLRTHCVLTRRAATEGDLRADVDPDEVGRLLLELVSGVRLLAAATRELDDLAPRLGGVWQSILPVFVPESKVEYFRQFAARRLR